jgi:hypothetical protein
MLIFVSFRFMTSALTQQTSSRLNGALRFAAIGVVSGWLGVFGIPAISTTPLAVRPAIAQASITDGEVNQYARSVLEIDQYRNTAYTEIQDLLASVAMEFSDINVSCSDTQDISQVPRSVRRDVRELLVDYCNRAQAVVEENGLSPRRFNEITEAHGTDTTLYERIQQELIRLQQDG